ncbi:MAG: Transcriptional regulatory protein CseB [Verrucomicrobia bacterium ADurb.Bin122]|nr:MAG: Transcriptional regulatory protein CseB [Verrucomicrobia bacterium ADurb.Bin122]HOY54083.1 response regulator transcription factor [Opitutaceae bacterium]HPG17779.1 response regulator transcription factor [Opitutaceae bacterium]
MTSATRMRILIADDDLTSRTVLTSVLQKLDYDVTALPDGQSAWEALQQNDAPRLVILDWLMPGIDGVELCRRIRSRETDQPPYLILLTTRAEKKDISEGLNSGANDYLTKPFDLSELRARLAVGARMIALQDRLFGKILELRDALEQIKTLRGIVPICSSCKKIRDDKGYWSQVEAYISRHSDATFSHGICPDCLHRLYPEFANELDEPESPGSKPPQG